MRPEQSTLDPSRSPREPSRHRVRRPSGASFARRTLVPLLLLSGGVIATSVAHAGSVTYNVVTYPTDQNGYTVSGTIQTNGDTGTALPGSDITSWDITIRSGATTILEVTPSNTSNGTVTFDATPTEITIGQGGISFFDAPSNACGIE
jgi:hypothetical protein